MEDMILSVNSLPEALRRRIRTDRVRVHEEGGIFTLTPVNDLRKESWEALEQLRDMLSDGRMSADGYSAQKRADKELER